METKEIKELMDQISKQVEELKEANDAGNAETVSKIEDHIAATTDELKEIKVAMARAVVRDVTGDAKEKSDHSKAFKAYSLGQLSVQGEEYKNLNVGTDAEGGFLVPPSLEMGVIDLLRELTPARMYCNVIQLASADYNKNFQLTNVAGAWRAEAGAATITTSPTFGQFTIAPHELYANPQVTLQMLEDGQFDIEAYLAEDVAQTMAVIQNTAFTVGDGSGKPNGLDQFIGASAAPQVIEETVIASATAVTNDELVDLVYQNKPQYRQGSIWVMNRSTLLFIRKLKDDEGRYLFERGQLDDPAIAGNLLGYPVYENEDVADMAADNNAIYFGNFKRGYTIVDRIGMSTLRNPYINPGFVEFYTRTRVGGGVEDGNALRVITMAA